jgi:hypothetical protein
MGNSAKTGVPLIVAAALIVAVRFAPTIDTGPDPKAKPKPAAPVDDDPPVVRPPDAGPRVNAQAGALTLAGVRVGIKEVWVSRGIDDGAIRWGNVPTDMWMKVRLTYEYLDRECDATYYWWTRDTAKASAVYDARNRKSPGVRGHGYTREETRKWLKQGTVRPTEETIYFKAPRAGSPYYDLDFVPEHLLPGEKYQFRIPGEMVEWGTKN